ncbi:MAG: CDP-alcohol phosphatidyltransferase family protein [Cyanobium sp.]
MERSQGSHAGAGPPEAAIRWTLPNLLSLYRLVAAAPLAGLLAAGLRGPFALLLLISLLSDALDGLLARLLHQQSAFGARLDNWADTATFWVALVGVIRFAAPAVRSHAAWLGIYALLMAVHLGVMVRRFGGIVGLHAWSFKLAAWLQGPAALLLLWSGRWSWFTSVALGCGLLALLEELVILALLREPRTDVRGLWWLWREGALR